MSQPELSQNSLTVLKKRYLARNEEGQTIEDAEGLFRRVAQNIAQADLKYGASPKAVEDTENRFHAMIRSLDFLPNSPTLGNAGRPLQQLAACFVLPIEDSIESIYNTLKYQALIHQTGGGTGFSFSRIRPKGDVVKSSGGVASGPVSFMKVYNHSTEHIKQGGTRRGANMGILRVDHPDILEFITCKQDTKEITNFNISVGITTAFMQAYENDKEYDLINPKTGKVAKRLKARDVMRLIAECAWKTGEPGMFFIDEANRKNPVHHFAGIEATNPCVTADTWVQTTDGPKQVKDLIGKQFEAMVNGEGYLSASEGFFSTGKKDILVLTTEEGYSLELTANHPVRKVINQSHDILKTEWCEAGQLKPHDTVMLHNHRARIAWDGPFSMHDGYTVGATLGKRGLSPDVERASSDFYRGVLSGLFDTHGTIEGTEISTLLISLDLQDVATLHTIQRMLLRLGIVSDVYQGHRKNGLNELAISGDNLVQFEAAVGFTNPDKLSRLNALLANYLRTPYTEQFTVRVKNIEEVGTADVYDVQIPGVNAFDANGFLVHNCGEQPLLPFESCTLGSVNLERHLIVTPNGKPDVAWAKLEQTAKTAIHFLDNVIDMNKYPIKEIERVTLATRKVGLGVMGFSRMLFHMGLAYDSVEGIEFANTLMGFIRKHAEAASMELAKVRGVYPAWEGSRHQDEGKAMRNSYVVTVAPTGTISMIADTSGGCEPEFSLIWFKNVMDGTHLPYVCDMFVDVAKKEGFWTEDLLQKIQDNHGSVRGLKEVPVKYQQIFATAHDVSPEMHVRMQAAFQANTDSGVSKTINLPTSATVDDVLKAYELAYSLGCKGVTVYRDGSRHEQVLNVGTSPKTESTTDSTPVATAQPVIDTPTEQSKNLPDLMLELRQKVKTKEGSSFMHLSIELPPAIQEQIIGLIRQHGREREIFFSPAPHLKERVLLDYSCRLASHMLRSGFRIEQVLEQLTKSYDQFGMMGTTGYSLMKGMAQVATTMRNSAEVGIACPECSHRPLVVESGCLRCANPSCGWSRC